MVWVWLKVREGGRRERTQSARWRMSNATVLDIVRQHAQRELILCRTEKAAIARRFAKQPWVATQPRQLDPWGGPLECDPPHCPIRWLRSRTAELDRAELFLTHWGRLLDILLSKAQEEGGLG